ncbi:MAG: SWIM zinc finger family protein [Chloroflexota bacterium]|nr:MAG: SWIM zinc finger family protein [Chloroflexota bacterium]
MALAPPVLEQTYRYAFPSSLVVDGDRHRLRLATSGGPAPNPRLFRGRLLLPVVAADLLLTLGDVARSRFHVPAQMLKRILELADPVATCADDRLRFEAFSACCSVYGRVDLTPAAYAGDVLGRGTTNVDFGPALRTALAGVQEGGELGLAIGASEVEIRTDGATAVERRVPLPSRWLRGFLEVQAIQAELAPLADLDATGVRAFFRSIPKQPSPRPAWLAPDGSRRLRVLHHDPGGGAVAVAGMSRLRLFQRVARHATSCRIWAVGGDGSTAWQVEVPGSRLTLVLSPEVWRGFSGEGRALHRLADAAPNAAVAAVRGALGWEPRLDVAALAASTGRSRDEVEGALAALAVSGIVGYDLAEGGFFRRELPFDAGGAERQQPRLRAARQLVERAAVRLDPGEGPLIEGWVSGAGADYRVRETAGGWSCTCPWYGRHRGDRGPCKHVLAVQLVAAGDAG